MPAKKSLKNRIIQFLAPRSLKWLLVVILYTCRKKWIGRETLEILKKKNQNWIYSLWHNNISYAAFLLRHQKLLSMVSSSDDGRFAATVIELFGNRTIRGSSSKGGAMVLLSMIKGIKSGSIGVITPDGPRGPKYTLQSGAISISRKTKVPLVPIHVEATRQWIFHKSWDRHKFPKPFSTIIISIGKPYLPAEKMNSDQFESARKEFELQMISNVKLAEETANHSGK